MVLSFIIIPLMCSSNRSLLAFISFLICSSNTWGEEIKQCIKQKLQSERQPQQTPPPHTHQFKYIHICIEAQTYLCANVSVHVCVCTCARSVQSFNSCTSRPDASDWLYKHPGTTSQRNKPSTSKSHVACKSKLLSVVSSSMHPCPGNRVATRRAVVYYVRTAHAFSAEIECQHCTYACMYVCICVCKYARTYVCI